MITNHGIIRNLLICWIEGSTCHYHVNDKTLPIDLFTCIHVQFKHRAITVSCIVPKYTLTLRGMWHARLFSRRLNILNDHSLSQFLMEAESEFRP